MKASSTTRRTNRADPLGPDSLTWKYFGDLRTGMMGIWIGALQNMYPELGAGVEEHSVLLREPLQRVARSVYPIMGVVYDGDRAAQTGQQIKGFHATIKGVDTAGRRYHALNPETFYWAHATFFMLVIKTAEYFCGGLTEAEKRQLFDELVNLRPKAQAPFDEASGRERLFRRGQGDQRSNRARKQQQGPARHGDRRDPGRQPGGEHEDGQQGGHIERALDRDARERRGGRDAEPPRRETGARHADPPDSPT